MKVSVTVLSACLLAINTSPALGLKLFGPQWENKHTGWSAPKNETEAEQRIGKIVLSIKKEFLIPIKTNFEWFCRIFDTWYYPKSDSNLPMDKWWTHLNKTAFPDKGFEWDLSNLDHLEGYMKLYAKGDALISQETKSLVVAQEECSKNWTGTAAKAEETLKDIRGNASEYLSLWNNAGLLRKDREGDFDIFRRLPDLREEQARAVINKRVANGTKFGVTDGVWAAWADKLANISFGLTPDTYYVGESGLAPNKQSELTWTIFLQLLLKSLRNRINRIPWSTKPERKAQLKPLQDAEDDLQRYLHHLTRYTMIYEAWNKTGEPLEKLTESLAKVSGTKFPVGVVEEIAAKKEQNLHGKGFTVTELLMEVLGLEGKVGHGAM